MFCPLLSVSINITLSCTISCIDSFTFICSATKVDSYRNALTWGKFLELLFIIFFFLQSNEAAHVLSDMDCENHQDNRVSDVSTPV